MKKKWTMVTLLVCWLGTFAAAQQATVLVGVGSTAPLPLYMTWRQEYNKLNRLVQMDYLPLGTGEGITQIENGKTDFGVGEVLLTPDETTKHNLVELPAAIVGIVPVYNLPDPRMELRFSGELLADIFLGEVRTWNDPRVARLNPGVALPKLPIKVYYRPGGKGTNYVFTDFLSKTSAKFHDKIGRTPSPNWPVGTPAERSSDMGEKVKSVLGAIGYIEVQYIHLYHVGAGRVLNPAGKYVKATQDSLLAAVQAVIGPDWTHFTTSLTYAPGADSYPVTSFSWLYLRRPKDARRTGPLADFVNWMFADGQRFSRIEGYPRLPDPLVATIKAKAELLR